MKHFFADLHIHLGSTYHGKPVKISASSNLTLPNVLNTAFLVKGMQIVGIIDCHVPEVIEELEQMIEDNELYEHEEGGLIYKNGCLIPGSEIEVYDDSCNGPIHVLVYFPDIDHLKQFSSWLISRMTNPNLSSQRFYGTARELQEKTHQLNGLFIIAHAFTPFKSMYGKGVERTLVEVFDPDIIDGIELGLSSDIKMADQIKELHQYPYLTNSDAHSLEKIAREYQVLEMKKPSFHELKLALTEQKGRKIFRNFGLNPLLGKYYQTCCAKCGEPEKLMNVGQKCLKCKKGKIIKGVYDRIKEIGGEETQPHNDRPGYTHQVPLEFIPGVGPGTLRKLRTAFGTDMNVIHTASSEELLGIIPEKIAEHILASRTGKLNVQPGGGGKYGSVSK
ncbi:endonuclease Q family protein [Alkalihalobacillus sp. AL-G]|uniref:endonuclease Q family protein n=1 Tax=Alkalihalobacillus sp. AL-G TaxID=2926399 RepID=UPI00272CC80F|nr:endonuclease Q family protein [Alkalihalobacillus sp. AL-G]WLD91904.1 endonuclease Q family protein [Alkalihalobacillus sp. AL-G]